MGHPVIKNLASEAPPKWALIAFTIFAISVTAFDFALVYWLPFKWREPLTAYTGITPSTFYMFSLIFVAFYAYDKNHKTLLNAIFSMMGLQILFGLYFQIMHLISSDEFYRNTFSPLQSLYTILLPMFWLMALFYPSLRQRFYRNSIFGSSH